MRKSLLLLASFLTLVGLTACSSHSSTPDLDGGPAAADAMFAQMMIPHHEQAVVMADLAPTRTQNTKILEFAAQIKSAQQPEIDQMSAWLAKWDVARLEGGEAMAAHGGHGMKGMLTNEQLAELEGSSGANFDRLFSKLMIEHHLGAIDMATQVAGSSDPRVAELAGQIIKMQQLEIELLRAFTS
ncbi:MAG: DUF305 domain-containing protein [Actinomycetota bacterium]|nr:DUF305 domain-containing protein [Actinomycetota bacterium]